MASRPPAPQPEKRANIPDYRIVLDGQDVTPRLRPRLVSLTLAERRDETADQLDLVLDDADGTLAIPRTGVILTVELGWLQGAEVSPGLVHKGRFKVDEAVHAGPPDIVTVRARSVDFSADFRIRRERTWRDTTLGAVLREIAGANGLDPRIDAGLAAIPVPVLDQHEKSDMALLRELGWRHDAIATVKDGKLVFSPKGKASTASGAAIPDIVLARAAGDRHEFRRVDRTRYDGAEARWHDQDEAKRKSVKAGGTGKGKPKRLRRVYATEADAKAAAGAEARRIARGDSELDINLALGRADIYPDRPAQVTGFKAEIDAGKWLVAEVTHQLDRGSGFRTRLKLETRV